MTPNTLEHVETRYSVQPTPARMQYASHLAGAGDMIPAGLFDKQTGRPSPAKIFLVLETGAMLGLDPMAALQGIDVIEGRATISPRLMLAFIRAAGHAVKITKFGTRKGGDIGATVWTKRADTGEVIENTFTIEDAAAAELCTIVRDPRTGEVQIRARAERSGKIKPWEAYPQNMCVWRAAGMVAREGYEDLLMGIAWTPEELNAVVDEDGVRAQPAFEEEAAIVQRISEITDKADMRKLYREVIEGDGPGWTARISAEFDGHLASLTFDSDEAKPGRPGHTGSPDIDALTAGEQPAPELSDDEAAEVARFFPECPVCGEDHDASTHDVEDDDDDDENRPAPLEERPADQIIRDPRVRAAGHHVKEVEA